MTNTELIKKLDPSGNFVKNKYAREYLIPKFHKVLSIEEVFYLYKNDKLDISLLERTEDGKIENVDDKLFSNYKFIQTTRKYADSMIKCIVTSDDGEKEVKLFSLSSNKLLELTLKGEILVQDKLPFGGSTNFYLKLKVKD